MSQHKAGLSRSLAILRTHSPRETLHPRTPVRDALVAAVERAAADPDLDAMARLANAVGRPLAALLSPDGGTRPEPAPDAAADPDAPAAEPWPARRRDGGA